MGTVSVGRLGADCRCSMNNMSSLLSHGKFQDAKETRLCVCLNKPKVA